MEKKGSAHIRDYFFSFPFPQVGERDSKLECCLGSFPSDHPAPGFANIPVLCAFGSLGVCWWINGDNGKKAKWLCCLVGGCIYLVKLLTA